MDLSKASFWGYRRENGRVGVRNHLVILPVDDLSNAAAQAEENSIKGTLALPHPYGSLQFGADLDLHFRTLIGAGSNPNVAAAIVIGIEEGWTARVVEGIKHTGKPVCGFGIEGHGDHETIRRASQKAKELLQWASELRREQRPLKDLWVSTKCGESDTTSGCGANPTVGNACDKLYPHGVTLVFGETTELTGGEQLVAARCRNDAVRTMSEHIDVDVSGLLRKELTPDQAGDRLLDCMFRTANGRLTAAEALGHREFVLTRLYESA